MYNILYACYIFLFVFEININSLNNIIFFNFSSSIINISFFNSYLDAHESLLSPYSLFTHSLTLSSSLWVPGQVQYVSLCYQKFRM